MKILILDDTKQDRDALAAPFREVHDVRCAADLESARQLLNNWWPDVAIVDAVFPKGPNSKPVFSAGAFVEMIEAQQQHDNYQIPDIVLVSGHNEAAKKFNEVCTWLEHGRISDVIPKSTADIGISFFQSVIQLRVEKLLSQQHWKAVQRSSQQSAEWFQALGIVTCSPKILALRERLLAAAASSLTVLIQGPNGSGKELVAHAIHARSRRRDKALIKLNCAAIPTGLLESELFGHERGAFTGAISQKIGYLEIADQGTLFLDEIGDIPIEIQPKLLRVLEDRKFERLGSTRTKKVDVRLVAATNRDLEKMMENGEFRSDLYYRLAAVRIQIPPLCERKEDIPLLVHHFFTNFEDTSKQQNTASPAMFLAPKSLSLLCQYNWPGNVRQLKNCIESAAHLELVRHPSADCIEIPVTTLLEVQPELSNLANAASSFFDGLLQQLDEPLIHRWSDLRDTDAVSVLINERLAPVGRELFAELQRRLESRTESQDPAAIHCYKALLYLLLTENHTASITDLQAVLHLRAWDSVRKVADILTDQSGNRPASALVAKIKSEGRWLFELSPRVMVSTSLHT